MYNCYEEAIEVKRAAHHVTIDGNRIGTGTIYGATQLVKSLVYGGSDVGEVVFCMDSKPDARLLIDDSYKENRQTEEKQAKKEVDWQKFLDTLNPLTRAKVEAFRKVMENHPYIKAIKKELGPKKKNILRRFYARMGRLLPKMR